MKLNKVVKKIAALSAGVAMLGATLLGAAAADLSEYPAPFVKDGAFNGELVVGDQAATEDVVGAIEIGMALQYAMKETQMTGCGTTDVTINEGVKIEGTGTTILNYGEDLEDVRSTLDVDDLPVILADGSYYDNKGTYDNEVDYTQYLYLKDGNMEVDFDQPDNDLDAGDYLTFKRTADAYEYKLEFDEVVDFADDPASGVADDLENTKIKIQGNEYTITKAKYDTSTKKISELTLMAGDTVIWLQQDQPITKIVDGTEHEIQVVDVTENEDSCGVSVDGTTAWIDVGSTETINGVEIGVTDAKAIHAQLQDVDVCELNVGASEIVLPDGDYVKVNGMEIKKAKNYFDQAANEWSGFHITYKPDDKQYLTDEEYFVDPVFGNFKFVMGGVTTERETYEFDVSGENGDFTFINNEGKEVSIPIVVLDTNSDDAVDRIFLGEDSDALLMVEGDHLDLSDAFMTNLGYTSFEDLEGTMLYAINGETAHILEISDIDTDNNKIEFNDLTYGRKYTLTYTDNNIADDVLNMGSLGEITLNVDESNGIITATDLGNSTAKTNYNADISVTSLLVNTLGIDDWSHSDDDTGDTVENMPIVTITEDDESDLLVSTLATIKTEIKYDNDDRTLRTRIATDGTNTDGDLTTPVASTNLGTSFEKTPDSDTKMYSTVHGTLIEYDSKDYSNLKIMYPEEEVEVNVFIAPVSAELSEEGGNIETTQINKINVGAAKLASEVTVGATNLILVGGPCANDATAEVMGVTAANCAEGFEPGKAMIKLYDTNGKVALVVAGYSAEDTRRATTVLADYTNPNYALEGSEVVVTGTSLSDISVGVPQ